MSPTKLPISALPLPPKTHILAHNLTPDPLTPTIPEYRTKLASTPSFQRRARLAHPSAHFSHVTPLPVPFPFRITPPDPPAVIEDKDAFIESWFVEREPLEERTLAPAPNPGPLRKYSSVKRDELERELIGISDTGLEDCLPQLAVGDAFAYIGSPTLARANEEDPARKVSGEQKAIREELVDVLSGHSVLLSSKENTETPYAPWSLRYSGHQFGNWAGQLGDGRAISILATPHPSDPSLTYELQLKGAGRTPFSRTADGLAVVRSSIREYLGAEAMHALSIPTTRSLALINLPSLPVVRESVESASIVTRMAPSFIRLGSFEALSPPQNVFFFGLGQQDADYEALRILGQWVVKRVLRLEIEGAWGREMVLDVARRNARMVAGWQAYGFMHGVINTDNVSILGLTIDYGPYAFMDVYDSFHICNHSDDSGRYSYKQQPDMILYALRALLNAVAPLIGAETEKGGAVSAGFATDLAQEKIEEWRKVGLEVADELEAVFRKVYKEEYLRVMRKRLGLRTEEADDGSKIIDRLLSLMEQSDVDFHITFRKLCLFPPSTTASPSTLDAFLDSLIGSSVRVVLSTRDEWRTWLRDYASRIEREKSAWGSGADVNVDAERKKAMRRANPRFVLRQWVLEEMIKKVEEDPKVGRRILAKVLHMACNPFDSWGAEDEAELAEGVDEEIREERRFCDVGDKRFLGFQCSCSS